MVLMIILCVEDLPKCLYAKGDSSSKRKCVSQYSLAESAIKGSITFWVKVSIICENRCTDLCTNAANCASLTVGKFAGRMRMNFQRCAAMGCSLYFFFR